MVDLEDLPVIGKFVALSGGVLDLLFHSGEFVFLIVDFLLSNVGALTAILRILESLANRIPLLPAGIFDELLTAMLIAFLVVELGKLGQAALQSDS